MGYDYRRFYQGGPVIPLPDDARNRKIVSLGRFFASLPTEYFTDLAEASIGPIDPHELERQKAGERLAARIIPRDAT